MTRGGIYWKYSLGREEFIIINLFSERPFSIINYFIFMESVFKTFINIKLMFRMMELFIVEQKRHNFGSALSHIKLMKIKIS